jgi:hypothetical protein
MYRGKSQNTKMKKKRAARGRKNKTPQKKSTMCECKKPIASSL